MQILTGPVEDFFQTLVPEKVWHYTTLAGFQGIVSSGTVWATEAHFTTDPTEFIHAHEIALDVLNSIKPHDSHQQFAKTSGLDIVNSLFTKGALSQRQTEVYVASFSATADLQTQWKTYADQSKGVSIAFDLRPVRPPQRLNFGITLAPCIYRKEHKENLLNSALANFIELITELHRRTQSLHDIADDIRTWNIIDRIAGASSSKEFFKHTQEQKMDAQMREAMTRITFDLLRLAAHCKSPDYSQEEEWRLALPRSTNKPLTNIEVQYRGQNNDIPYLASGLFQVNNRLPITEIMLGPLCSDLDQVKHTLNQFGYQAPITRSALNLQAK